MESEKVSDNQTDDLNLQNKKQAIAQLMGEYSKKVYLLAYSFVKDKGLAEDISQEVFLKCYRNLAKFRGDSEIKSWIYRITVNTSKDFLKHKSFNIVKFPINIFENMTKNETTEDIILENNENEQVLQAVLSLPSKYREVIILHYFHDLKVNEIVDALNINANTVKTRLARGRSLLKGKLKLSKGDGF